MVNKPSVFEPLKFCCIYLSEENSIELKKKISYVSGLKAIVPHLVVYRLQLGFWKFLFIRYDAVNLSVRTIKCNLYRVIITADPCVCL